jgi:hypothetical protein
MSMAKAIYAAIHFTHAQTFMTLRLVSLHLLWETMELSAPAEQLGGPSQAAPASEDCKSHAR